MTKAARKDTGPAVQSGVLAYRQRGEKLQILLITSRDTGRWVMPKGNVARGLTPRRSAGKEAFEEAGITGVIARRALGHYYYRKSEQKGGRICRVELFPMQVMRMAGVWPEKSMRKRKWMSCSAAARSVMEADLGELIRDFSKRKRDE
tara:strand:+ start:260 stop:703 length:444 start_codon:yes stop_codon:yes gene_type:complete